MARGGAVWKLSKGGYSLDQQLMEGMVMFNIAVEDPTSTDIECSDDNNQGYIPLSRRR